MGASIFPNGFDFGNIVPCCKFDGLEKADVGCCLGAKGLEAGDVIDDPEVAKADLGWFGADDVVLKGSVLLVEMLLLFVTPLAI